MESLQDPGLSVRELKWKQTVTRSSARVFVRSLIMTNCLDLGILRHVSRSGNDLSSPSALLIIFERPASMIVAYLANLWDLGRIKSEGSVTEAPTDTLQLPTSLLVIRKTPQLILLLGYRERCHPPQTLLLFSPLSKSVE